MTIHYLDEETYNNIDMANRNVIIYNENYNRKLEFDVYTGEPMFITPGRE